MPSDRERVYEEVRAERARQDARWGGPQHDDDHGYEDWREFREKYEQRIHVEAWRSPFDGREWQIRTRESLIKIAALAVAQIESLDRGMQSSAPNEKPQDAAHDEP